MVKAKGAHRTGNKISIIVHMCWKCSLDSWVYQSDTQKKRLGVETHIWKYQIRIFISSAQRWYLKPMDGMWTPRKWVWRQKSYKDLVKGHFKSLNLRGKNNQKKILKRSNHWLKRKTNICLPMSQGKRGVQREDGQWCPVLV